MNKKHLLIIIVSLVLGLGVVAGAVVVAQRRQPALPPVGQADGKTPVTHAQLAEGKGVDGHDCLVAVDKTVYRISDFSMWQNGKHTSSGGLAYCGADLSKAIDQSPHGRKMLDVLEKIGPLVQ